MTKSLLFAFLFLIAFVVFSFSNVHAQSNIPALQPILFNLPGQNIPAQIDATTIQVHFNPKEISIDKKTPWQHHRNSESDAPTLEFTSGEPYRLQFELFFDRYEEGKSVQEYTDKIQKLVLATPEKKRPPVCLITWGDLKFKCVLESFDVKFTDFLSDGTPVRASANIVLSEFVPADKKLSNYALELGQVLELIDASQNSLPLLNSYGAESLQTVQGQVFGDLDVDYSDTPVFPLPELGITDIASGSETPDEIHVTKGFRVEVSGPSGGKNEDNAWETATGGALNIEVAPASVGSDQFQSTPGHKFVEELQLKGPMKKIKKDLVNWIKEKPLTCKKCKDVTLSLVGQDDKVTNQIQFQALDVFFFKNEILFASIQDDRFYLTVINIERTRADGSSFSGPPRIFVVLPTSSPAFTPVVVAGTGFDNGAIPFFGSIPSVPIFNTSIQNIPLIGSISTGVTIVPPAAPAGAGNVRVEYFGQMSNPFPFTKN
ncbi:MAG: hypothetical protein ACREAX_04610 [Candidatus Nitrosotenuis sp.]